MYSIFQNLMLFFSNFAYESGKDLDVIKTKIMYVCIIVF